MRASEKINQRHIENLASTGALLDTRGIIRIVVGEHHLGIKDVEQAIPLLERSGEYNLANMSSYFFRLANTFIAGTDSELQAGVRHLQFAESIGYRRGAMSAHQGIAGACARRGDLARAMEHQALADKILRDDTYLMSGSQVRMSRGYCYLQASDYPRAAEVLIGAWDNVRRNFVLFDQAFRCLPMAIESLAGPNWLERKLQTSERTKLKRLLRWAPISARLFGNIRSHVLRSRGRAMAALGRQRKAIHYFEKAIKVARRLKMKTEVARALLDLAAVKEEERDENRAEAIDFLVNLEAVIPRAESWLLGDQYDEKVVAPDFDIEAWEREHGTN